MFCIVTPSVSIEMPVSSWNAMNDWTSGVVRTPPKSEITHSMLKRA